MRLRFVAPRSVLLALALAPALAACGDPFALPPAGLPVSEQRVILFALSGTPVNTHSAYSMLSLGLARTDQTNDYDFAFEIGPADKLGVGASGDTVAVLLPRGSLGFPADGGFQADERPFDEILLAPESGYDEERPAVIVEGSVYIVSSRRQQCNFGFVRPRYAKLWVELLDLAERVVWLRVVIDPNCGYRSLAPGFPTR